ncbi:hypothetical protein ES288_D06G047000v1 [Gossypium darwinii]|uniref:Uncharacterized protein n=1 Tax=Gossypium darwinii TaxID=34276 RepID=A0A5D2C703_GOSDA|nr:hypothetical protein ES288_D06G047000v1 [Gossypium darwinii]
MEQKEDRPPGIASLEQLMEAPMGKRFTRLIVMHAWSLDPLLRHQRNPRSF